MSFQGHTSQMRFNTLNISFQGKKKTPRTWSKKKKWCFLSPAFSLTGLAEAEVSEVPHWVRMSLLQHSDCLCGMNGSIFSFHDFFTGLNRIQCRTHRCGFTGGLTEVDSSRCQLWPSRYYKTVQPRNAESGRFEYFFLLTAKNIFNSIPLWPCQLRS